MNIMTNYENVINEVQGIYYDSDTLVSLVVSHRKSVGGDGIALDIPFDPWDIDTLTEVLNKHFPEGANVEIEYLDDEIIVWLYDTDVY